MTEGEEEGEKECLLPGTLGKLLGRYLQGQRSRGVRDSELQCFEAAAQAPAGQLSQVGACGPGRAGFITAILICPGQHSGRVGTLISVGLHLPAEDGCAGRAWQGSS